MQRTASPIGSIAQNLIPLFQIPLQAKAMQQQQALEKLKILAQLSAIQGKTDPEKRAAEIAKLKAETDKTRGEADYRQMLLKNPMIAQILSGQGGEGTPSAGGMKPKVTLGITGPGISYSSDVLSPEALAQKKEIAAASSGQTLQREKALAKYKATELPAKPPTQERQTVEAG